MRPVAVKSESDLWPKVKVRPVAKKLYEVPPCSGEQEMVGVEEGAGVVCKEFLKSWQSPQCQDQRLRSRIGILDNGEEE